MEGRLNLNQVGTWGQGLPRGWALEEQPEVGS